MAKKAEIYGYTIYSNGRIKKKHGTGVLAFHDNKRGYLFTRLQYKDRRITKTLHRLLAEAFIPNPEGYKEVDHKDGNKKNNKLSNLRWCTRGQNIANAYKCRNRSAKGENNARCKTSAMEVKKICRLLEKGTRPYRIRDLGYDYNLVRSIKQRKNWRHISKITNSNKNKER